MQLSEWQKRIEERQASGIRIEAWCEYQRIGPSTYYYYYRWRKVREYLCRIIWQLPEESGKQPEKQRIVPISMPVSTAREGKIELRWLLEGLEAGVAIGTHNNAVQFSLMPTFLRVLCSVPVSSSNSLTQKY